MIDESRTTSVSRYDDLDTVRREFAVVVVSSHVARLNPRRLSPIIEHRPLPFPPVRRRRYWPLAALLAVPALGATAWLASTPLTEPRQTVDVALPAGIEIDLPALQSPPKQAAAAKAAPILPVAKSSEKVSDGPARLLTLDKLAQVEAAVRQAFASGVAQPWAAKGMEGYVVAGPVQIESAHVCRNIAIWAKGAGAKQGQTIGTRKCMAAGGAWIDVGQPESMPNDPPAPDQTTRP